MDPEEEITMATRSKKEAVKLLLDYKESLRGVCVEDHDFDHILEAIGVLDAPRLGMVWTWLDEVAEKVNELDHLKGQLPAQAWRNAALFGVKLPEVKKLEALAQRIRYLWIRQRPGILPKYTKAAE